LLTTQMCVDEGLGGREAETVEIDASGRNLETTAATLGWRGRRPCEAN
jgi:hypothetical protein